MCTRINYLLQVTLGTKAYFFYVQTKTVWQFFTLQIMYEQERPLWPKYPYMYILVLSLPELAMWSPIEPEGRNKYVVSRKTLLSSSQIHGPSISAIVTLSYADRVQIQNRTLILIVMNHLYCIHTGKTMMFCRLMPEKS